MQDYSGAAVHRRRRRSRSRSLLSCLLSLSQPVCRFVNLCQSRAEMVVGGSATRFRPCQPSVRPSVVSLSPHPCQPLLDGVFLLVLVLHPSVCLSLSGWTGSSSSSTGSKMCFSARASSVPVKVFVSPPETSASIHPIGQGFFPLVNITSASEAPTRPPPTLQYFHKAISSSTPAVSDWLPLRI